MEKHEQGYPIKEQARHLSTPMRVSGATPVTEGLLSPQVVDRTMHEIPHLYVNGRRRRTGSQAQTLLCRCCWLFDSFITYPVDCFRFVLGGVSAECVITLFWVQ
jgi:hypothetical protein